MLFNTKTAPAMEPVTLAEARAHLRVDFNDEDDLIKSLIVAARHHVEGELDRPIIDRTYTAYGDCLENRMELKPGLKSVASVKYLDADSVQQSLPTAVYQVNPHALIGEITLAKGQSWPSTSGEVNSIEIEFTAGMAADSSKVPGDLKAAILLVIGTLYENRESVVVGTITNEMPLSVSMLLAPYRIHRIG